MNIIVTIFPTNLVTNLLLAINFRFVKLSASRWSGNEKHFCYLSIASYALLQKHALV